MQNPDKPIRTRVWFLCCLMVLLTVGVYVFLPSDPLFAARSLPPPRVVVQSEEFKVDDSLDAKFPYGTQFPQEGAGLDIRRKTRPSARGYLVVGLGDCSGCLHLDVHDWEKQAKKMNLPLVAYTPSDVKQIERFKADLQTKIPIYTDPSDRLHAAMNCYFSGRVYYFDQNWRLAWRMGGVASGKNLDDNAELLAAISQSKGTSK